tara:strand:- start:225 stop:617 length:393 start_codon:yes stop_codon:yes gene_type:complete
MDELEYLEYYAKFGREPYTIEEKENLNLYRRYDHILYGDIFDCESDPNENVQAVDYRWNNFTLNDYEDYFGDDINKIKKTVEDYQKNNKNGIRLYLSRWEKKNDLRDPPFVALCPRCDSDPMADPCEHEW